MELEELNKRLYKEKQEIEERPEAPRVFSPGEEYKGWQSDPQNLKKEPILSEKQKKIFKLLAVFVGVALVFLAGFLVWRSFYSFDTTKVYLQIFGPDRIASGEEVRYIIKYQNQTRTELKDVKLTFFFPEDSSVLGDLKITTIGGLPAAAKDIGALAPGASGEIEFRANVVGLKNDGKKASVSLEYQPANMSSGFKNSADFSSEIFSVPLILDFDLPDRVVSGQPLNFSLKYLNTSEIPFYNMILSIDLPPGFNIASLAPLPDDSSKNIWSLPEIAPREEGKIMISGIITGDKNETKSFKARIGYKEGETIKLVSEGLASAVVSVSPLAVEIDINGQRDYIANSGEGLNFSIKYQDMVDVPISSAYIIIKLDSKFLDLSTLRIEKGFLNNLDNSITWNESSVPDLKMLQPGEQKTINFSVSVKEKPSILNYNDKNFVINTSAKIDSSNVPASLQGIQLSGADQLSTKINSKLILSSKGYFHDNVMPNSGPLPPRVGQQTTYTIYWRVINYSNDVENAVVESYLPPNVKWLDNYESKDQSVKYDLNSGKLTWTLGTLAAGTGIISPVRQLVFQVGLVPSSIQVGSAVELIKGASISGKDLFTQKLLEGNAGAITTDLPDDPLVNYFERRVVN